MSTVPAWIVEIIRVVRPLVPRDFVGQIEVNCFLGGITNVNVKQSHKPEGGHG